MFGSDRASNFPTFDLNSIHLIGSNFTKHRSMELPCQTDEDYYLWNHVGVRMTYAQRIGDWGCTPIQVVLSGLPLISFYTRETCAGCCLWKYGHSSCFIFILLLFSSLLLSEVGSTDCMVVNSTQSVAAGLLLSHGKDSEVVRKIVMIFHAGSLFYCSADIFSFFN